MSSQGPSRGPSQEDQSATLRSTLELNMRVANRQSDQVVKAIDVVRNAYEQLERQYALQNAVVEPGEGRVGVDGEPIVIITRIWPKDYYVNMAGLLKDSVDFLHAEIGAILDNEEGGFRETGERRSLHFLAGVNSALLVMCGMDSQVTGPVSMSQEEWEELKWKMEAVEEWILNDMER